MATDDNAILAMQADFCQSVDCKEPAIYRCHGCGLLYCIDHASEPDPQRFCNKCLEVKDTIVEQAPLLDKDGTRHEGRVLRPVGNAFTKENKLIHEMSDDELKDYIRQYTVLVREAEQLKTFREINLSNATHEAFSREIAKLEKVGGEIIFPPSRPRLVKKQKEAGDVASQLAAKLSKMGITPEKLAALIEAAKKVREKKG